MKAIDDKLYDIKHFWIETDIWACNLSLVLKKGSENHQTLPYINKNLKYEDHVV